MGDTRWCERSAAVVGLIAMGGIRSAANPVVEVDRKVLGGGQVVEANAVRVEVPGDESRASCDPEDEEVERGMASDPVGGEDMEDRLVEDSRESYVPVDRESWVQDDCEEQSSGREEIGGEEEVEAEEVVDDRKNSGPGGEDTDWDPDDAVHWSDCLQSGPARRAEVSAL